MNFQCFLYLSHTKLSIAVYDKSTSNKIYSNESPSNSFNQEINFSEIEKFLENNILEIEKIIETFVNEVFVIIEYNNQLPIKISLKTQNYEQENLEKKIQYLLNEAKFQIEKTYINKFISHILIKKYIFDNQIYYDFKKDLECDYFFVEFEFICFSNKILSRLEEILKKHQISVKRFLCANYIKTFFKKGNNDIFQMAINILDGSNKNEVVLVKKKRKTEGFFEKFFHFFN